MSVRCNPNNVNYAPVIKRAIAQVKDTVRAAQEQQAVSAQGIDQLSTAPTQRTLRRFEDASAARAIHRLERVPGPITGRHLQRAILRGAGDRDARAASAEYRDFARFVHGNWQRLSPDAKAKWRVYQEAALTSQAQGRPGIPRAEFKAMATKMRATRGLEDGAYRDAGARKVLSAIDNTPGVITSGTLLNAFRQSTNDVDGQLFGREFFDFARFADKNWGRMTAGAKAAFRSYQAVAAGASRFGQTAATAPQYQALFGQMAEAARFGDLLSGCHLYGRV